MQHANIKYFLKRSSKRNISRPRVWGDLIIAKWFQDKAVDFAEA